MTREQRTLALTDAAIALGEADKRLAVALDAKDALPGLTREYNQAAAVFDLAHAQWEASA